MKIPAYLNHPKGKQGTGFLPAHGQSLPQDKGRGSGQNWSRLQDPRRHSRKKKKAEGYKYSAPRLECLVHGTHGGITTSSFSFGELQRTNSSVCPIKATEPFLDGECPFGFVEKTQRQRGENVLLKYMEEFLGHQLNIY